MVNWSLLNEGLLAYFHASQSIASCADTCVSRHPSGSVGTCPSPVAAFWIHTLKGCRATMTLQNAELFV